MELIIITIITIAVAVFLLSFNIIFRKDGEFPSNEIGHHKELRDKGLMCAKAEERILWQREGEANSGGGCSHGGCCGGGRH